MNRVGRYRELMELLGTVEELSDSEYMAAVAEAREEIRLGQILTLEELDKELGFTEDEIAEAES
jgi:hypothetical protein